MPFNIGAPELIIILIIALIVLGPGKLPDVAQSLGKSLREFRHAASDITEAGKLDAAPATPATPAPNQLSDTVAPNTLGDAPPAKPASTDTHGNAADS
jgi:sec-independent protein translocase protein TatA